MAQEGYDYCESRTKVPFTPEYFSGLNWRDAETLVGKVVEFSDGGEYWYGPYLLDKLNEKSQVRFCAYRNNNRAGYTYIRTCPETHAPPLITIGDVELPRPETESPRCGGMIWVFTPFHPDGYYGTTYQGYGGEEIALKRGFVHLAESRAQAWADWWENTVMAEIKK